MVRPVLSIDIPRAVAKSGSRGGGSGSQPAQVAQGSWTTGIVTEIGSGGAWVDIPADSPSSNAWGPTDGTLFAVGARVIVQLDSLGKVSSIGPAVALPDDVEVVATGSTGEAILAAQSGVNETREALTAAKAELEENQQQLADNLAAADQRITDAAQEASEKYALLDQTRQDVEQVRDTAQGAADLAAQTAEVAIISVVTEYAVGSSETVAPTSGWSTSTPARTPGTFIWSRTTTTKGGETQTSTTSDPVLVTGSTGAGVSSVTTFYALVGQGVAAPAKPTTNPPAAPWSLTEPAYTSSTELYRVDLTVLTSGSWSYGAVSKVSSYTAATQAKGVADQALTAANLADAAAKGLVKASQTDPGHAVGRIWFVLNAGGNVIGMKISNGSAWSSYAIITEDLMVVGSDGTIRLKDGVVSGVNLVFDNAFVTGLMATDAFLTSLWSSKATVSGENLWKNQRFDPLGPVIGAVSDQTPPVGNARLCNRRNHQNSAGAFDVTPGDQLVVEVTAKRTAGARALRGGLWWTTGTSGNGYDGYGAFTDVGTVSGDWHRYRRTITVPANKSRATLYINIDQSAETGFDTTWHVADATIRRAVGGELIVDGAVTASKITASSELWAKIATFAKVTTGMLVAGGAKITGELLADIITLATRLVAGDPDGTRVELDGTGLTVYRTSVDGAVLPAIRLGLAGKSDFFGILDTSGDTLSSLDEDGNITGQTINANEGITLAGQDLAETLQSFPLGVIALAGPTAFPPSISNLRTSYGLTEISFTAPFTGDRVIKVGASFLLRQWGHSTNVSVVYTTDGTRPDVASPTLIRWTTPATDGETDFSVDFKTVAAIGLQEGQTIRMLLVIAENGNDGNIAFVNSMNPRFWVEDIGPYSSFGGVINSGGGSLPGSSATPPATTDPVQTRTKTYNATACQSYLGSGAKYAYNVGKAYQGSYGSNTGLHSLWIFPSVISDLSGATVNKVILRITNQHSYYNSGATARIQTHGQTSVPTTYAGGTAVANVAFAKGQTKDINLTSQAAAGLKSGAIRGFGLLASAASDYGYWSGDAKLIITYTK